MPLGVPDVGAARAAQQRLLVGVPVVHRRARARGRQGSGAVPPRPAERRRRCRRRREGADGFDAQRALGVLQEVAKRAGWDKRASLPKGRGMGVAFQYSHRGYFAEVADVTVDAQNRVKVNKVWVVGDIGSQIVNPSMAINQSQGAVIDGLSQLMNYEITIDAGKVVQSNFDTYQPVRMRAGAAGDRRPLPDHEQSADRTSASRRCRRCCRRVSNAIFAATGKRVRTLAAVEERLPLGLGTSRATCPANRSSDGQICDRGRDQEHKCVLTRSPTCWRLRRHR